MSLPGESQGRECLVGCHLWGHTESDTTKATLQQQQSILFTKWGSLIETFKGLNKERMTSKKEEFCQQTAFGLYL